MINGVDDLLSAAGPDEVLRLFDGAEDAPGTQKSQAQMLIELAREAELFHSPAGEAFARLEVGTHHEVWGLRSTGFRQWLTLSYFRKTQKPPSAQALQDAIGVLAAGAQFNGPEVPVALRVAGHGGKIYIDLGNADWTAVEVDRNGWRVVTDPPVRFKRARGMLALPTPTNGGSIAELRKFINFGDDSNWTLCVAWLAAAYRPQGPYPILILQGEQGSAKSTMARFLRRLVDPSVSAIRTPPREEKDLLIAANNSWVLAYDNLSGVPVWFSDALCRLSTGGGFSTRQLYTDSDEIFFDAMRPMILNGIDQIAERADLADRSVILTLPRINLKDRRDEADLYDQFEREIPQILGALFSVVSAALDKLPDVRLASKPRMADFAVWATAAEEAIGLESGEFMRVYAGNRTEAVQETLESDVVAAAILKLIDERYSNGTDIWEGSSAELLGALEPFVEERLKKTKAWPTSARGLSARIKRLMTFLREVGVLVTFNPRGAHGSRSLTIRRVGSQ